MDFGGCAPGGREFLQGFMEIMISADLKKVIRGGG